MASNNPPVIVELDSELAEFVIENCEANMTYALNAMQIPGLSREAATKFVELNEKFKRLRDVVKNAS